MPTSVFVVDDEPEILGILKEALTLSGFEVSTFNSGDAALEELAHRRPDLMVTDLRMPGTSGLKLLGEARQSSPDTQVVILTGFGDMKSAVEALRLGAYDYLTKPVDADRLAQTLRNGAERRRLLLENRALIKRLQEANRIKAEFLNGMSHEVRTPLGHILGFAQMLEATLEGLTDKQVHYLANIQDGAQQLLGMFEDILQLSVLKSGGASISPTAFCVASLLENSRDRIRAAATEKTLTLEFLPPQPDPSVSADPEICHKVLSLLLDNAVEFTPQGGCITVRAQVLPTSSLPDAGRTALGETPADGWLLISVADTGSGIAQEDQERIFGLFEQGDASLTRHHGGTGLGLALARSLARIHGGDILLDSRPGQGSTFTLVVPVSDA